MILTLRATRRRQRRPDPLASTEAVRGILDKLRATLPDIIPNNHKATLRLLRAVRHIQRYSATDTRRGRPSHWKREDLLKVSACLGDILERETSSRTSVASYIDHYVRLLDFPVEITEALTAGDINLFEAEQLARVTPEHLNSTHAKAKRARTELLLSHQQAKGSGERLRQRINELLRDSSGEAANSAAISVEIDDLEDFDPYDSTHLFWEQIKQLGFAFREIRREDVLDEEIEELLKASEPILAVLSRIQRRKEKKSAAKLMI